MVKSLRRSVAKARLFDSGRWHKWWAWYGRLRWFKCGCCKTTYVSQGGSSLMVAAIQL